MCLSVRAIVFEAERCIDGSGFHALEKLYRSNFSFTMALHVLSFVLFGARLRLWWRREELHRFHLIGGADSEQWR